MNVQVGAFDVFSLWIKEINLTEADTCFVSFHFDDFFFPSNSLLFLWISTLTRMYTFCDIFHVRFARQFTILQDIFVSKIHSIFISHQSNLFLYRYFHNFPWGFFHAATINVVAFMTFSTMSWTPRQIVWSFNYFLFALVAYTAIRQTIYQLFY